MPPELLELYSLYQQELATRNSEKEANYLTELNIMLRVGFITLLAVVNISIMSFVVPFNDLAARP